MDYIKITPYKNDAFTDKGGTAFEASINPEKFSITRGLLFQDNESTNTDGKTITFKGYQAETLSFELYFDGTGVVEKDKNKTIDDRIKALWNVVYKYEGTIHKPYYLLIEWKEIYFKCHCKSFVTEYQLFNKDGVALRAKVSLSFIEFFKPGHSSRGNYNGHRSSPDLTHIKTVRQGDSLPMMSKEVYGKTDYYIEVAKMNGLTNFRTLGLGEQILFPPVEK